jgi:hypothetical protein
MEITADFLVKALLGIVAAGGLGGNLYQGIDCQEHVELWQDEVDKMRSVSEAREIRDSNMCMDLIEHACGSP